MWRTSGATEVLAHALDLDVELMPVEQRDHLGAPELHRRTVKHLSRAQPRDGS